MHVGLLYPGPGYKAITHCKQAKLEVGLGSLNEAARVGMQALFQNEEGFNSHGQIATSLVPRPSHMETQQHCLQHECYLKQ